MISGKNQISPVSFTPTQLCLGTFKYLLRSFVCLFLVCGLVGLTRFCFVLKVLYGLLTTITVEV